jgi:isocitrate dehydrogenase
MVKIVPHKRFFNPLRLRLGLKSAKQIKNNNFITGSLSAMTSKIVEEFTNPQAKPITVAYGDGIGPEIMDATLFVLAEAKANIKIETIEVGQRYYENGVSTGIPPQAWESIHRTKVLLKAPITLR